MPLQDLTPQLRTRLNQTERAVGWFVFLATLLLLSGFAYYLYHAAVRKGWFLEEAPFYTYVNSAANLKIGDPVYLMGFEVGKITDITAMPPRTPHNVRVDFVINQINTSGKTNVPYFSYVWNQGSTVKLNSSGLLGGLGLEITRSTNGHSIYTTRPVETLTLAQAQALPDPAKWRLAQDLLDENSNVAVKVFVSLTNLNRIAEFNPATLQAFHIQGQAPKRIHSVWNDAAHGYVPFDDRNKDDTNAYELPSAPSTPIGDQLQAMVAQVQQALPNITNKLAIVLNNVANITSNLNTTIVDTQPLIHNVTDITGDLRGSGALGTWVLGTNATYQLTAALTNANTLLVGVNTNLDELTDQIGLTLMNVADITSNLNVQVRANSNLLWGISKTVTDSDDLIQGLKRHWLLRSAFKGTNHPAPVKPAAKKPAPSKNPPPTPTK